MANVLDKELIQYFTKLDEPQKKSLLEMIKSFLKTPGDTLNPVTVEHYNKELDEAMQRMNDGEFTTLDELEKEMQSW
ncbi:MAG: hypothetical protein ABI359_03440 [Ginsengibacter sp.]